MTLQIGMKKQNRAPGFTPLEMSKTPARDKAKSLTGFTLIELIIVAAIILVMIAMSTPMFRGTFRDLGLRDAAYNIGKMIQYAGQRSILEEKKFKIIFDFDKSSYRLFVEDGKEAEKKFVRVKGRFGGYVRLPEDVAFRGDINTITFLPNGRCDKTTLYIANSRNKIFQIKTNGRAGYVETSEVKEE